MDKKRWKEVENLVDKALSFETKEERTVFLQTRCGDDQELRQEVEALLDSIKASEGMWEDLLLSNQLLVADMTLGQKSASSSATDEIPEQLGPYRIKKRLGRGGMGDVFLAERLGEEFHKKVALKILRKEAVNELQIRRFIQERTILSSLNHPNIARLLDGGISGDGRQYIVMEYVDGNPITQYCRDKKCSLSERLSLFEQACKVVHYAHANLIVHRDLKPDNLLVTPEGRLKVLDFGIAKLLDQELSEQTLLQTQAGQRLLSLNYAAPEQITMEPVTTATDIYALGLLLYELLTDSKAFDLSNKNLRKAEQIIRYEDPSKPSSTSSQWQGKLKGDLDAIILKTLRKEPEQRYESASRLLEDIEHYRTNKPVQARKGTLRYRCFKFARRNKATLVAVAVFLIAAAGFGSYHVYQLNQERRIAEREAEKAQIVTDYMVDLFNSSDPVGNVADTLNVYDLLKQGKDKINLLDDQPELQIDLFWALGSSYQNIGAYEEAEQLFLKADSLSNQLYPSGSVEIAEAALFLGNLSKQSRDFESGRDYYYKAKSILDKQPDQHWLKTADAYSGLAETLIEFSQTDSAEALLKDALLLKEEHQAEHNEVLTIRLSLAKTYRTQKKYEEAEQLYHKILTELDRLETPNNTLLPLTLNNLAYLLKSRKRYAEAETYYRRSFDLHNKIYGEDHPNSMMILNNLASVTFEQGNLKETERLLTHKLNLVRQKFGKHWQTGRAYRALGIFYYKTEQFEDAAQAFQKSYDLFSNVLGPYHILTGISDLYARFSLANINGELNENLIETPGYKILKYNRPHYSRFDSISVSLLIQTLEEKSSANFSAETSMLKRLLSEK